MNIELKRLSEVNKTEIIDLMNNPLVLKYMPLTTRKFDESECNKFIITKETLCEEHG